MNNFSAKPYLLGLSAFLIAFILDIVFMIAISIISILNMDGSMTAITKLQLFLESAWIYGSYFLVLAIVLVLARRMKVDRKDRQKVLWSAIFALACKLVIIIVGSSSSPESSALEEARKRKSYQVVVNNIEYVFSPEEKVETHSQLGLLYSGIDLYISLDIPAASKYRLEYRIYDKDTIRNRVDIIKEYYLSSGESEEVELEIDLFQPQSDLVFRDYTPLFSGNSSASGLSYTAYSEVVITIIIDRWDSCGNIEWSDYSCGANVGWYPVGGFREEYDFGLMPYDYEREIN